MRIRSGKEYISNVKPGEKANRIGRIISIDYEKDAAMAKAEIIVPNWRIFADYFLLLKYEGSWKIVQKSYTWKAFPKPEEKTKTRSRFNFAQAVEKIVHKAIWIKTGYEAFALLGPTSLKIEPLAKQVGISKSSFYHHFADTDIFLDHLLDYHIQQSHVIANKEKQAQNIDPELINILIEHKIDLLFNRQLRIGRENSLFNDILTKSNQIVGDYFVMVWVKEISLKLNKPQLEGIFELALENFFLQITPTNLNRNWLSNYFSHLKKIISSFS